MRLPAPRARHAPSRWSLPTSDGRRNRSQARESGLIWAMTGACEHFLNIFDAHRCARISKNAFLSQEICFAVEIKFTECARLWRTRCAQAGPPCECMVGHRAAGGEAWSMVWWPKTGCCVTTGASDLVSRMCVHTTTTSITALLAINTSTYCTL